MSSLKLNCLSSLPVAAASGLVSVGETFYFIADDELSLFSFRFSGADAKSLPLFPGTLPQNPKERKAQKADLESLCLFDEETLLAIPSGSTPKRMKGAKVHLPTLKVEEVSFEGLYRELLTILPDLNIEGGIVQKETLKLFQRGNGKSHQNAVIEVDLKTFALKRIVFCKLGTLKGVPLSFTDATYARDVIWFLAVAEATESTYLDGEFKGAILGEMNENGDILRTHTLECTSKPEGLWIDNSGNFYVVTDDDDPKKPSKFYQGKLP